VQLECRRVGPFRFFFYEKREFWKKHDPSEYIDWGKASLAVFPNLKPTTKAISLRLPEEFLAKIKVKANKVNVPYQSLILNVFSICYERRANSARGIA